MKYTGIPEVLLYIVRGYRSRILYKYMYARYYYGHCTRHYSVRVDIVITDGTDKCILPILNPINKCTLGSAISVTVIVTSWFSLLPGHKAPVISTIIFYGHSVISDVFIFTNTYNNVKEQIQYFYCNDFRCARKTKIPNIPVYSVSAKLITPTFVKKNESRTIACIHYKAFNKFVKTVTHWYIVVLFIFISYY